MSKDYIWYAISAAFALVVIGFGWDMIAYQNPEFGPPLIFLGVVILVVLAYFIRGRLLPATAQAPLAFSSEEKNHNADLSQEIDADVIISTTQEKTSYGILVKSGTGSKIYDLAVDVIDISNVFQDMSMAPPLGFERYFPEGRLSLYSDGQVCVDIDKPKEFRFLWHTRDMENFRLNMEHDKAGRLPTELLPTGAMTIMFEVEFSAPGARENRQRFIAEYSDASDSTPWQIRRSGS